MKLKLNAVRGPVKNKAGREFWFATAETRPSAEQKDYSVWETLRWSCVFSDNPPPKTWAAGAEVDVIVRNVDYEKGAATFDVKA